MSRSAASVVRASVEAVNVNVAGQGDVDHNNRNPENERSGKGRRRREAAEQRRIDQQRWGQYITDREEDSVVGLPAMAPRSANRRRTRRNNRHNSVHHLEDFYEDELHFGPNQPQDENCDDFDLEMALSLSLSLAEPTPTSEGVQYTDQGTVNMSYESLVQLENVKCVAPAKLLSSMSVLTFDDIKPQQELVEQIEKCAICQCEYEHGDQLIFLACNHAFHHLCGSEWLLNHSKLCPICKHDVTDQKLADNM
eukprot:Gb_11260 [translate_table: standard]